ncbi:tail collar domain-containing protein [Alcanivorax sp. S71-1-4]|uniref:phage tail-collar fiber domain-containing protein n=1 Tax=Alcanivorax sp. S71-1-4 TaxID=1177159 RepID=UPI00135725E1|nr:phage tail protein [Alcanivorax sp. S71-1-4]KAF0810432.1 tail collar domain-containing protein [Alcanivorax sp. S71-1-4]
MALYFTRLTAAGEALIEEATRTETRLQITHMALCDGGGVPYEPSREMEHLINERYRGEVAMVASVPGAANLIHAEMMVPGDKGGFTCRALGLFAGATLVAVGNTPPMPLPMLGTGSTIVSSISAVVRILGVDDAAVVIEIVAGDATQAWVLNNFATKQDLLALPSQGNKLVPWDIPAHQQLTALSALTAMDPALLPTPPVQSIDGLTVTSPPPGSVLGVVFDGAPPMSGIYWWLLDISALASESISQAQVQAGISASDLADNDGIMVYALAGNVQVTSEALGAMTPISDNTIFFEVDFTANTLRVAVASISYDQTTVLPFPLADALYGITGIGQWTEDVALSVSVDPAELAAYSPSEGSQPMQTVSTYLPEDVSEGDLLAITAPGQYQGAAYAVDDVAMVLDLTGGKLAKLTGGTSDDVPEEPQSSPPDMGVLKIDYVWSGIPPQEINIGRDSLNLFLPSAFNVPLPSWAINIELEPGDVVRRVGEAVEKVPMPPEQKVVVELSRKMEGGGSIVAPVVLQNLSAYPHVHAERNAPILDAIGDPLLYSLADVITGSGWSVSTELRDHILSEAGNAELTVVKSNLRDTLRGGCVVVSDAGGKIVAFNSSLSRRLGGIQSAIGGGVIYTPLSFSRSGRRLSWGAGTQVKTLDLDAGTLTGANVANGQFRWCGWHPTREELYVVSGGINRVWKIGGGGGTLYPAYPADPAYPAMGQGAFSPDGKYLFAGGGAPSSASPGAGNAIYVVDLDTFAHHALIAEPGWYGPGIFDAYQIGSDYYVASATRYYDSSAFLYGLTEGAVVRSFTLGTEHLVEGIAFIPDKTYLGNTDHVIAIAYSNTVSPEGVVVKMYDVESGTELGSIAVDVTPGIAGNETLLRASPDGQYLAVGGSHIIDVQDPTFPVLTDLGGQPGVLTWAHVGR